MSISVSASLIGGMFNASYAVRKDAVFQNGHVSRAEGMAGAQATSRLLPQGMSVAALERISDANLGRSQKESLIRMVAYIDERENSAPSLLRDILTLTKLMERGNDISDAFQMSSQTASDRYLEHRRHVGDGGVELSVDVMFSELSSKQPNTDSERAFSRTEALATINNALASGHLSSPVSVVV